MKRALITGINGFVGRHLAHRLTEQGWLIFGYDQRSAGDKGNVFLGRLSDRKTFGAALWKSQPDVVFHLAGVIKSAKPENLYGTNLIGTVSLFESLVETGCRPVVVVASSSAVYGSGLGGRPISEKFKPRPMTHYALSKLAQETVSVRYFDVFGLPVIIARMFNLLGPGQSPDLACSAFARQIALAENTDQTEIVTGNLDAKRDFVDVRDAVRAFEMIVENGKVGEIYNVCSGKAVSLKQCLGEMMSQSQKQLSARVDAEKIQTNDIPIQVGSCQKIKKACRWSPEISLKESLSDLLNDWRERVKLDVEKK